MTNETGTTTPSTQLQKVESPPPPPKAPSVPAAPPVSPQPTGAGTAANAMHRPKKGKYDENFASDFNLPPVVITTKGIAGIMVALFLVGLFFGWIFFSGGNQVSSPYGLNESVVFNKSFTRGAPRCGTHELIEYCVLYILNSQKNERKGKEFYDEAVALSKIPRHSIDAENIAYGDVIIKPGEIAMIKIPPQR